MDSIHLFFFIFTTFICSTIITAATRHYAWHLKLLDMPNERSSHSIPTPRGGGIAIVLTFSGALLYLWSQHLIQPALFVALTFGGLVIAAVGFYDDRFGMQAKTRACFHFSTATVALVLIDGLPTLDFGTWQFHLQWMGSIIGIISIVWLTNLYNFMDGIDGLTGSEGLFVCLTAGLIIWFSTERQDIAGLFFLFAASIAGFTRFNWPPAKIFLGDVGSGYLGFNLALLGIYSSKHTTLSISFWLILLAVFICDATFTVVRRAYHGKPWYAAHREHAYQRLILAGNTHKQITLSILAVNCIFLLPAALLAMYWPKMSGWIMLSCVIALYFSWLSIIRYTRTITP